MKTRVMMFVFAALQIATIAKAQTYTIQQIGLTDQIHTTTTGDSTNQLYGVNAAGQVFGYALRYVGDTYDGDDTWIYSPTTHTTQLIGLMNAAIPGTGGILTNDPVDMNAGGQVAGYATRYISGPAFSDGAAWLYSPATNTTQVIGLTDPVHTLSDGSSINYPNYQNAINASGQVIGYASRQHYDGFGAGQDVWIYSPATNTTQMIGLTGPAYTYIGANGGPYGVSSNKVVALNAAGQVAGDAALGGSQGNEGDAWLYSPATGATQRIGIYDSLHTENGYDANTPVALNAVGQVAGTANHFKNTGLPYNGQDAWIYSPATNTTQQIGLVDSAHTQTGDYSYHKPVALNDSGQIAGYSNRFSGSTDQGWDAWLYSSKTNKTQMIGLTDAAHTQTGGYSYNQPNSFNLTAGLNSAGQVAGFAKRDNGNTDEGQDTWLYSPATNTTQMIGLTDAAHTQTGGYSFNQNQSANPLNTIGQVVGTAKRYSGSTDEGEDVWLYDSAKNTTYNLVSSPSASGYASSEISYLGDDGTVLGDYKVNGGATQDLFLWSEAAGFHDLGDLIQGGLTTTGWASLADAYGAAYGGSGGPYIIGDGTLSNGSGQTFELTPAAALAGDYNHNGVVDAADYVVWRKGLGTTYTQADYDVWRAHFGQTAGSGAGASANAAVPEPATLVLLILVSAVVSTRRRRAA